MKGKMEWWNGGGAIASSQHPNTPALQHSNTPKLRSPPGFTLIELLAVVAIMSIILIAAIPMFQSMGKRDIGMAGSQLRATVRLARQYAVTQRQYVFVVFPDNVTPCETNDVDKLLRAYAVVAQPDPAVNTYEYVSEWRYLPQGVYFVDDGTLTGSVFRDKPALPFPDASGGLRNMAVFHFRPNGGGYKYYAAAPNWRPEDNTVYFTSSHFYSRNGPGTALVRGTDIPGATNNVRVRRRTGQAESRTDVEVN